MSFEIFVFEFDQLVPIGDYQSIHVVVVFPGVVRHASESICRPLGVKVVVVRCAAGKSIGHRSSQNYRPAGRGTRGQHWLQNSTSRMKQYPLPWGIHPGTGWRIFISIAIRKKWMLPTVNWSTIFYKNETYKEALHSKWGALLFIFALLQPAMHSIWYSHRFLERYRRTQPN